MLRNSDFSGLVGVLELFVGSSGFHMEPTIGKQFLFCFLCCNCVPSLQFLLYARYAHKSRAEVKKDAQKKFITFVQLVMNFFLTSS